MCGNVSIPDAEQKLADLIRKETGVDITPILLRLFIRSHWATIALLAHKIHES